MRIVSVDPGLTIGLASLVGGPSAPSVVTYHTGIVTEAWKWCIGFRPDVFVIESFVGGGARNKDNTETIRRWGYFEYRMKELGVTCVVQEPSRRLHKVSLAEKFCQQRDEVAALAHAFAAWDQQMKERA